MKRILRVFPRGTSYTPDDEMAFVGAPPLFRPEADEVHISCTFTWDLVQAQQLAEAWGRYYRCVYRGGPAYDDACAGDFVTGRYVKEGVTFTSRGCPKRCPWCLVPSREGAFRELATLVPGHIVQDNNILACSDHHWVRVIDMLRGQKGIQFKGGLDLDYLNEWHVDYLKQLSIDELWIACDTEAGLARLDKAAELLSDFSIEKRRCYVLGGFLGDTVERATKRCEAVYAKGFLPFAQCYRGPSVRDRFPPLKGWSAWGRHWTRPAIYRSKQKEPNREMER